MHRPTFSLRIFPESVRIQEIHQRISGERTSCYILIYFWLTPLANGTGFRYWSYSGYFNF